MTSQPSLLRSFRACQRYKQARSWQKPFINPRRFFMNQLRRRGVLSAKKGSLRTASAFHMTEFTVVEGEGISREIESYGIYEDALTEAFLHLVKPNQVVVDVGMHLGYYTTLFAYLVTGRGEVHAFEPTPSTREIARLNVERFPQIVVHPEALWSDVETLSFRDYGLAWMAFNSFGEARTSAVPEPKVIPVRSTTLDEMWRTLRKKIALVKIDAESAESRILRGGQKLIESDRPLLSVEVGDMHGKPGSRSLIEQLSRLDYVAWEFREGSFHRHQLRDKYAYDNLIFTPADCGLSPD